MIFDEKDDNGENDIDQTPDDEEFPDEEEIADREETPDEEEIELEDTDTLLGEWSFESTMSHISIMKELPEEEGDTYEYLVDISLNDYEEFFMSHGDGTFKGHTYDGEFITWIGEDEFTGKMLIEFTLNDDETLDALIVGDSPLGDRELIGGVKEEW
jgi:hypothetical protein